MHIASLLPELDKVQKSRITSERQFILSQFIEEINKERPSKYTNKTGKKITLNKIENKEDVRAFCVKLGHLKDNGTLYFFLNECRRAKAEKGSFSFAFNYGLKVR